MIQKIFFLLAALAISLNSFANGEIVAECCDQQIVNDCQNGFYVRGDLLYWKPHVSGLELSFGKGSIDQTISDQEIVITREYDTDPKFSWDAGYRLAAGYQFNEGWEALALWTHFRGNGKHSDQDHEGNHSHGHFDLKFNQIDVAVAYKAVFCPLFSVKTYLGVRGARIHEDLKALQITSIISNGVSGRETRSFDDKQTFNGVGPLFGVQGNVLIGSGFDLYALVGGSVLFGHYKLNLDDSDIFTQPILKQVFSQNKKHLHSFTWNVDLALGIHYETSFCDSYHLDLNLGVEHHQYFNENHIGANLGDLALTGGVFTVGVGF